MLIALLLPAVQAAREAARRMQCSNKSKQLALAVHNFHDTYNRLPCFYADPIYDSVRATEGGWLGTILPFIEQTPLYSAAIGQCQTTAAAGGWTVFYQLEVLRCRIDAFLCPSDPYASSYPNPGEANYNGPTNYRGSTADIIIRHLEWNWGWNTEPGANLSPRSWLRPGPQRPWGAGSEPVRGGGEIGLEAITDGTSNTVMLSEGGVYARSGATQGGDLRSHQVSGDIWVGYDQAPINCFNAKGEGMQLRSTLNVQYTMDHNLGTRALADYPQFSTFATVLPPNSPSCGHGFYETWSLVSASSYHTGGVNAAFCDGSVRFISNTIQTQNLDKYGVVRPSNHSLDAVPTCAVTGETFSYGVWAALGSINGGESASLP